MTAHRYGSPPVHLILRCLCLLVSFDVAAAAKKRLKRVPTKEEKGGANRRGDTGRSLLGCLPYPPILQTMRRSSVPSSGTILIVDDSPNDVELLLRTFKQVGVQNPIHVCTGGAESLKYLFDTGNEPPAMVLLDLKMPGVDGFHVLNKVKSHPVLKDAVVIVLTTSSDLMDIALAYELGANSFLTKPLDLTEFREMVSAFHNYWVIQNQPAANRGKLIKKPAPEDELMD